MLGLAFADTTLRVLDVCEFDENDKFSNLESVLIQRTAKECLLACDAGITPTDTKKIHAVLERCGVPFTERKLKDFKSENVEQDLTRLVGSLDRHLADLEKKHAMAACKLYPRFEPANTKCATD